MTELWTFQIVETAGDPVVPLDLAGYDVDARDGHVGKVDEATYETGSSYLVVDTGFWIFGKKRLIPAGVIEDIDLGQRKVFIALIKDQLKQAPDFDQARRQQEAYHRELDDYYQRTR
jgi:hypothetical protein